MIDNFTLCLFVILVCFAIFIAMLIVLAGVMVICEKDKRKSFKSNLKDLLNVILKSVN